MPAYMDLHLVDMTTYEDLAEGHRRDIEAQEAHDVRFLGYWFDPDRGVVSCLAEAPEKEAMVACHAEAHGQIPTEIIEVDLEQVAAFMGRASEPAPDDPAAQDFRPDSPFRTVMFTDMVGSTALTMHLGDAEAIELLERHDAAIRGAVTLHGGRIVKHTGDGFLISFDRGDDALEAAIRIQQDVSTLHELLAIKIGINPGNPVERGGDLFGMTVQGTARICEVADGGQILVSAIMREICSDSALLERFVDHGREPIRGTGSSVYVYEIRWRDG